MLTSHPDGVVIEVWVVPGASRSEATGVHDDALRLRVAAPAEGGKANKAVIKLLRSMLDGNKVELISGSTSRRKRVLVRDITVPQLERTLRSADALGPTDR